MLLGSLGIGAFASVCADRECTQAGRELIRPFHSRVIDQRQVTFSSVSNRREGFRTRPETGVKQQTAGRPGRSEADIVFIAAASRFILNRVRKHGRT